MVEEFKYRPRDDGSQGHDVSLDMSIQRALHESGQKMIAESDKRDFGYDYEMTIEDIALASERGSDGWQGGFPSFKRSYEAWGVVGNHIVALESRVQELMDLVKELTDQIEIDRGDARSALAEHVSKSRRV